MNKEADEQNPLKDNFQTLEKNIYNKATTITKIRHTGILSHKENHMLQSPHFKQARYNIQEMDVDAYIT